MRGEASRAHKGPRCRTHLCPRVPSSLLFQREHRARSKGGASVPHSFTDRCECPHEESLIAKHSEEGVPAALLIHTARPQWHVV